LKQLNCIIIVIVDETRISIGSVPSKGFVPASFSHFRRRASGVTRAVDAIDINNLAKWSVDDKNLAKSSN
jgi:hypothetical protein